MARLDKRSGEAVVARVQVLGGDLTNSIKSEKPKDTAKSKKVSITRYEALIALAKQILSRSQCRNGEIWSTIMEGEDSKMTIDQANFKNLSPP